MGSATMDRSKPKAWGRGLRSAAAAGLLLAALHPAALRADDFTVPEDLRGHAILSCQDLTLSGSAVVTSEGLRTGTAEGEAGHVRSNGAVILDGGVEVHGDAVAGPGHQVIRKGQPSLVTGQTSSASEPFECVPIDLAALAAELEAANDDDTLPPTAKGHPALGGADGRALVLSGRDSLSLPAGTYLLSELRLTGNSSLDVEGPVRILVTGEIDVEGGSHINLDGDPWQLRLWSSGASVSIASQAAVHAFLYAPAAAVGLAGHSRVAGAVQADRVSVDGGSRVLRVVDDAPPDLEVTSPQPGDVVGSCEIPVTGRAEDGEGAVTVTVNGAAAEVSSDGTFTATASLFTDDPGLVVIVATDQAGNTTRVEVRVAIVPPVAVLVAPAPGSLVGQRVVDVSGQSGTATSVTVDGVAAQVPGDGTFHLSGVDLGEEGLVTLTLVASNCGGSVTATPVVDLDTQPPVVSIDSPAPDALFGATPISVSGPVEDAHLTGVTVNGVAAVVSGGRFTADGVSLAEGENTLYAVATDALGRTTTSAPVTVQLDTTAPTATITSPATGTVVATPTITVQGEVSDPNLAEVQVNGVVATVSGTTFTADGVALAEGENFVVAQAVDTLGHQAESPSVVVTLDTLPPEIALDTAALPALTGETSVTVTGTVSDPHLDAVTVNGVTATVAGGTFAAQNVPLAEGDNAIVAEAVDTLGHHAAAAPATVTRDTLAPEVAVTEPAAGADLDSRTVTVRGTVVEPHLDKVTVGGVEAVVSAGTWSADGVELPEGASEIVARATDVLGHAGESAPVPVVVDTLAPVVHLDSPLDPLVTTSTVTVTGTVDEPHLGTVTVAGVQATVAPDGTLTAEGITLVEGPNEITATASDTFGHEATSEPVLYDLDTLPPEVTLTAPLDGEVVSSPEVTVTGTALDPHLETVTVAGVAATVAADGSFTVLVPVGDGANVITAVATDRAGHSAQASVSVLLDTLPPSVTVDTPAPGACLAAGAAQTVGGTFVDPNPATGLGGQPPAVQVEVQPAGGAGAASYTGDLSADGTRWSVAGVDVGSADGTATATVVATDLIGNASRTSATWRVDATAPVVALTLDGAAFPGQAPGAAPAAGESPTLFGRAVAAGVRADDGAGSAPPPATLTLDGAPYAAGTPIDAEGDHLLIATATDCAGHAAAVHALFRIDRSAPTLASTEPAAGARLTAAPTSFSGVANEPLSAARVNGHDAALSGTSFQLSPFDWQEGANQVTVELVDLAGNRTTQTVAFEVHTVPLSVAILESGVPLADGAVFLRAVQPEIRSSDSRATVTATLDGAPFVSGTEVSTSGLHHVAASAQDDWGRTAAAGVSFTVDLGAGPQVAITAPADGAVVAGPTVAVTGSVSGQGVSVTVNGVPATVSGGTWQAAAVPLEPDAPTALEAVARDAAGRTATDGVTVVRVANGPQVLILDPPDGVLTPRDRIDVSGVVVGGRPATADGMVTVSNPATGASTSVGLAADGTFRVADVPLAAGANALRAEARDPQDRLGSVEVQVTADFTPPTIAFSADGAALAEGASFGAPITLTVDVADGAGTPPVPVVRLNGVVRSEAASPRTEIAVPDEGGYVVSVVATDAAGNETRAERSFILDFGGCALSDVQPPAGAAVSAASVTLVGRSGAAGAVSVRVPNGSGGFTDYPAQVADGTFLAGDVPLPVVGTNALVLVCTDAGGTERTVDHAIERLPAGEGPTVHLTAPAEGALLAGDTVSAQGTVTEGSVTVNGTSAVVTPGSGADTFTAAGLPLVEGPNVISARAVDGAGRTGTDRVVVERDSQAPRVQITRPDNKARVGRPAAGPAVVDVAGLVDVDTEPNLAQVVVSTPSGQVTATVDPATGAFLAPAVPLDAGVGADTLQTVTVTATDAAGHAGTSSVGVYFDPTGPALVLDAPEDLQYFGTGAPAQLTVSGDAWARDGATVSVNGTDLDPASLAWDPPDADGRRHVRFTTSIPVPASDGAFAVVARVTELDDTWAQDRRLLFRDTTPPTVVETVPVDGTDGVDPDSLLLVLFSEPVLHSSLAAADGLTLTRDSTGQAVVGGRTVAGQAVAFAPGAALAPGEGYVFRAGTGVTDRAGNALAAPVTAAFTVAAAAATDAPTLDPLPAVLCADQITVSGSAVAGATVEVRDGDLSFRGFAEAGGHFSISVPAAGSGYHLLSVRAVDPTSGAASPEATEVVRIDCSAPQVSAASFDRDAGTIRITFSEAVDPATVAVGDATAAIRLSDAEMPGVYQTATVAFPEATVAELALDGSATAWWRDRPVRLQVGPPAADLEGNAMTAVFETVFFPGAPEGVAGGFLFGEAYDDAAGRPLAGATVRLFPAGAALPGAVAAGSEGAATATATTDGRGRYVFAGDVASGRYVLVIEAADHTRVYRRLSLAPAQGMVPFDSRLTPRADAAGSLDPAAGGTLTAGGLTLEAGAGALAGTDSLTFRLTALSGQGLPDFLPLGWTPAAAAEVEAEAGGAALPAGDAGWLPGAVHLDLALPAWVTAGDELVAVRHEPAGGRWLALPALERLPNGRVRLELSGPGTVAVVLPDADPATRPPAIPTTEGEALVGVDATGPTSSGAPELTADLSLDPSVVPPTGRSRARVVARSADGATPWPSGLAVQAYLDEKLVLAGGGGQLLEAPFSADLLLYHPHLSASEAGGAAAGAAGAMEFMVSPSPRAAQVLLDVGYENIRLFPFPEDVERGPVVGPTGGTIETPEGVVLEVPEGALSVQVPVSAELLDGTELAALPEVAGFDTLAAVRVDLAGQTLGRPAALSLPAPAATAPAVAGDPRLVLAERIDVPADGRAGFPRLVARARLDGSGEAARIVASPDQAGALPLDGLLHEGLYLVLQARQPIGFATGFVHAGNGNALESSRVTADGLGTADVTPAGGRYSVPAPAGTGATLRALHPFLDEAGSASIPVLEPGQVVSQDLTVQAVPPHVVSVSPVDGATDQPVGTAVSVLFSEPLAASTVTASTLTLELAGADGGPSGLTVDGAVSLSADGLHVLFTPARPLLPGRTFLATFAGGVADAGGTFYQGSPVAWSFTTSTVIVPGGQVHPELFHVQVPVDGVSQLYGDAGAVPSVPSGETPWVVTPEIEGPTADPVRDTFQVGSDGSFSGSVGHPPDFAVDMGSRIWVKVFDPSGALAAEFRLGPFATPDGRGFVSPAGEAVDFRSADGVEVQVPAGAFDTPTLVTVKMLDPGTLGLPTPAGLGLGAYVDLDFEGQAKESLRLSVPAPADAPVGSTVFVGAPKTLPWGKRLQFLTVGAVVDRPDGRYLSNDASLQPELPQSTTGNLTGRSSDGSEVKLGAKSLPRSFLASRMQEFQYRTSAAWFYEFGASWTMVSGAVQPFALGVGSGLEAIYNKLADLWVYVPTPHDWNGGFVLPVLSDQPLTLVRRDVATGWILSEAPYAPPASGSGVVDVGFLAGGPDSRPLLTDASPFHLVRFRPPGPDESDPLALEIQATGSPGDTVVVSSVPDYSLAAGSTVALYDLTPALPADPEAQAQPPVAGPSFTVCDPQAAWSLPAMASGEEMLLVVAPGDLDAASAGVFELQFDRPLVDLTDTPPDHVAHLLDLGPLDGCGASGASGYPRDLPVLLSQEERNSRLVVSAAVALPSGHRFRLDLETGALVGDGGDGLAAWDTEPYRFDFATREVPGQPVAGTPSGEPSLGSTDVARDMLKLGNLLLVASENGDMVSIDASDTTDPQGLHRYSVMNRASSFIRALATDGHNRVFYAGEFGPIWGIKALRLEDVRQASETCLGQPAWAAGLPCFKGVVGSVRVAYALGFTSGFTASEWLAAGTLPSGTPEDLAVLTQDEKGRDLPLEDFVSAYSPSSSGVGDLTPDANGVYTFPVKLVSTLARGQAGQAEPSLPPGTAAPAPVAEWRNKVCDGEEDYDRYQRVTVDNLTTGESWSIDVENTWPDGSGDGQAVLQGVRARRGDRLRVRYNLRAIGHVAILGSGITVVDLNRFYRLTQPYQSLDGSQCGRRLGKYEGQEIQYPACVPSSVGLFSGLSLTPAVETVSATGCDEGTCRGAGTIDVYAPIVRIGALHATSKATAPGDIAPQGELAACINNVGGEWTFVRDVAVARDVSWLDRGIHGEIDGTFHAPATLVAPRVVSGDLMALSLGDPGVFVFDVSERSITGTSRGPALIGYLRVPGHSIFRVQADPVRQLLFAGGTDIATGGPVIDVWDLSAVNGAPGFASQPVPLATLHAAWNTNHLGVDAAGTGLVYTWDRNNGPQVVPFAAPNFVFSGLYRPDGDEAASGVPAVERPTGKFVPLGVPVRAELAPESPEDLHQDERQSTAAFKLRVALPGSLGPELTAKIQSLRALPGERYLASEDVGASVQPPGGPGWPDNEVVVRLRRLGVGADEPGGSALATGESGPLGPAYQLYESVETVLLEADPRARKGYERQDAQDTEADEKGQCRHCDWPAYLPDPEGTDPALDDVKELVAGRYLRAFLYPSDVDGATPEQQTRDAIAWFEGRGDNYPLPTGTAEVATPAAGVGSPLQVALAEPAANPAMWDAGEAGVASALTGGELLLSAADHAVAGRSIPFVFGRSYRSGTLGYGPLGAAGWWSPLFARLRELPSGEVDYQDGQGHVWRFPPGTLDPVPDGYEPDPSGSYDVPKGLFLRLEKLAGGQGWLLISTQHGTARFDASGRLIEIADRHFRGGTAGDRGSRLVFHYDPFGQLLTVVDDLGRRYRLEYYDDPRPVADGGDGPRYGLLAKLTDFVGRTVEYRWDDQRRLTEVRLPEVENPVSDYSQFSYTGSARPTLHYAYDPQAGASPDETTTTARLHGKFAKLLLASFELPDFVDGVSGEPRARFDYDTQTGRLETVGFPTRLNSNSAGGSVEWSLDPVATTPTAGPAGEVDVRAPWGHVVEHHLTDGRVTSLRESLEVYSAAGTPSQETVTTAFTFTGDGRLKEALHPDGGRTSLCYADGEGGTGCPGGGDPGVDLLQRSNVIAREEAATGGSQGTADYTAIDTTASYQEDNLVSQVSDGESRPIEVPVPQADGQASAGFQAEGVSARFTYDAYGRPKTVDGGGTGGPHTELEYGKDARGDAGAGLPSRIQQGSGDQTASWESLEYDDAYNVETMRSSFGEVKRLEHDAWDRPVRVESGLTEGGALAPVGAGTCAESRGAVTERAYDAAGHLARERRLQDSVDPVTGVVSCRWVEIRYTYNLREQVVGVEETYLADPSQPGVVSAAARQVEGLSYDEDGRLAATRMKAVSRPDLVTAYRYDDAGRVAGTTTGAEGERRMGYDTMSRVVYRTDGDQGIWRGRYDAWDRLYQEDLPTGAVTLRRYDKANQPIEIQTFSADPATDPNAELLAHDQYHVTSFGAVDRTVEDLTATGERRVTETTFDGSGRPTVVWSGPEGTPGRVDLSQARREVETVYEQDSGRVLEERFGGAYGEDPLHAERFAYSTEGAIPWPTAETSLESVPGQSGLVQTFRTSFTRDVFGRRLTERRSDGEEHLYTYDRGSKDLLRVRTGAGTEASYSRDGRGLPVKVVRPKGRGYTLYSYDLDGRRLIQTSATAEGTTPWQTSTTYDATGRVAAMDYADGTRETRTYFPDSKMATVTTRDGITLTYAYDAANRPLSVVPSAASGSAGGAGTTLLDAGDAYSWDPLSRPTELERGRPGVTGLDPDLAVSYPSYDLASRPSAEVVGSRDPLSWSWDVYSRPTEVRLPSGPGRDAAGAFLGFSRSYDTLDHLASAAGLGATGLSATPLGATWSWGGASRLYAMTTRGALGTGMRLGYHLGAGPQVPGASPDASSAWKLGRLSWGAVGSAGPTAAPAVPWGDFGYGWRGYEGAPSDGAKIGRQVLDASGQAGVLADLGWSWGYDAGVRLSEAVPGAGSLSGTGPASSPESADRFTFGYGDGDELQERVREATGAVDRFTLGDYGRIASRDGASFGYDPVGRRLEDDRFVYRWDWRGQLVSVEVKATWPNPSGGNGDGQPDVAPYAGQKVTYSYDARGRLERRLHEGVAAADGTRPFIEERRYVWEEDRLATEAAYGAPGTGPDGGGALRWRRTYVPGPSGLDDPTQVVVEVFQPGSPYSGEARTYTYLHDELGTIVGLVAEDEGSDPAHPPVPIRYRYTPYGEAHAETGPELLRANFRADLTEAGTAGGTVTQTVADETTAAPGGVMLSWSIPLDETTLASGLAVEQLQAGTGWTAVPASELIVGHRPDDGVSTGDDSANLRILLASGWQRGTSYRIRLTAALTDRMGRSYADPQDLQWSIPAAPASGPTPAVQYDQRFPTVYESYEAAGATAGGRFPAGQSRLFQGLWTDPVTGMAYARARWYDARNAALALARTRSGPSTRRTCTPSSAGSPRWRPTRSACRTLRELSRRSSRRSRPMTIFGQLSGSSPVVRREVQPPRARRRPRSPPLQAPP